MTRNFQVQLEGYSLCFLKCCMTFARPLSQHDAVHKLANKHSNTTKEQEPNKPLYQQVPQQLGARMMWAFVPKHSTADML